MIDTINRQNSRSILKEFFVRELKILGKASSKIFQYDEALPYFSPDVRQYSFLIDGREGLVP